MKQIFFKATWRKSLSAWEFSEWWGIEKKWDLDYDTMKFSDDVIRLDLSIIEMMKWEKINSVSIDCNSDTWEFRLFFN